MKRLISIPLLSLFALLTNHMSTKAARVNMNLYFVAYNGIVCELLGQSKAFNSYGSMPAKIVTNNGSLTTLFSNSSCTTIVYITP